ncbi:hypothetical protein GCM10011587_00840 [Pyruvatibacter mobilis]|nr:hypothetical protein GCM10011587_00840 [Pyruvatibacter mobilis]
MHETLRSSRREGGLNFPLPSREREGPARVSAWEGEGAAALVSNFWRRHRGEAHPPHPVLTHRPLPPGER